MHKYIKKYTPLVLVLVLGALSFVAYGLTQEAFYSAIYNSSTQSARVETTSGAWTGAVSIGEGASVNTTGADSDSYIEGDTDTQLLYVDAGNDRVGVSTGTPDVLFHTEATTALTNTVSYPIRVTHETSGSPANGIGVGLQYEQETSAANNELIMSLDAVVDDATGASEDASFSLKLMEAGAAAAEKFAIESTGVITLVNGETIDNSVDGTVTITSPIIAISDASTYGGDLTLENGLVVNNSSNGTLLTTYDSSLTNSILDALFLRHTTSGTPANGIGLRMVFSQETSAGNVESIAAIDAVASETTPSLESGELLFLTQTGGAAATEKLRIHDTGEVEFQKGIVPDAVTADPCGSGYPEGSIFYNDTANVLCFCDGTNDLKISDGSACF